MAMTEIRYDRGLEREREIEGEDRRNEEMKKERTMVWIRVKRDRKKGRWWGGKTWQRWELYRPRRTAGLYPLSSLCPHYPALWNEHYTSRWRTVEEYPRYFSLSRSTSRFLLRFSSSSSSLVPFLFFFFFPPLLSFILRLFVSAIFFSPFYAYHSLSSRQGSFFFSLFFLSFYIFFSSFLAYSRFRCLLVAGNPDEGKGETKTKNGKRNAIEGGSRGAVEKGVYSRRRETLRC